MDINNCYHITPDEIDLVEDSIFTTASEYGPMDKEWKRKAKCLLEKFGVEFDSTSLF